MRRGVVAGLVSDAAARWSDGMLPGMTTASLTAAPSGTRTRADLLDLVTVSHLAYWYDYGPALRSLADAWAAQPAPKRFVLLIGSTRQIPSGDLMTFDALDAMRDMIGRRPNARFVAAFDLEEGVDLTPSLCRAR